MRADAVEAVRWGFRIAFSRARIPGAPANLAAGPPSTCASGVTSWDEKNATPKKISTAPTPMARSSCVVVRPGPNNP